MDHNLKARIEELLGIKVEQIRPISGGDISQAFVIETATEMMFCKINRDKQAHEMFLAEKSGLDVLSQINAIAVPKVLGCEKLAIGGFILMEYIKPKRAEKNDMEIFGHQLATLHSNATAVQFGWEADNFIGILQQSNRRHSRWSEFYVEERLLPQIRLARGTNRLSKEEIPSESILLKTCEGLFPEIDPSLLHGDLWSGNYLISQNGIPYLIDPAIYFGHHEVDMAMTRLFGGFDSIFYNAYSEHFPKVGGEKERIDIYQLYYLLVHLNLFGSSYKAAVMRILGQYF